MCKATINNVQHLSCIKLLHSSIEFTFHLSILDIFEPYEVVLHMASTIHKKENSTGAVQLKLVPLRRRSGSLVKDRQVKRLHKKYRLKVDSPCMKNRSPTSRWSLSLVLWQPDSCVCLCVNACARVRVCVSQWNKVPDKWQARQATPAILQVRSMCVCVHVPVCVHVVCLCMFLQAQQSVTGFVCACDSCVWFVCVCVCVCVCVHACVWVHVCVSVHVLVGTTIKSCMQCISVAAVHSITCRDPHPVLGRSVYASASLHFQI